MKFVEAALWTSAFPEQRKSTQLAEPLYRWPGRETSQPKLAPERVCSQPKAVYHRPMDARAADVAAFVLAGGKSTRMGSDKAFAMLDSRTLLARALDLARTISGDVRIVGSVEKFAAFAPVVEDIFRDCGPLGGIHAALRASVVELNLMLAVDVPFVPPALLQYLVARARSSNAIATVPRAGGGWQPLCAVYRREFADAAEKALRAGRYKIDALFNDIKVQAVEEEGLTRAGFAPDLFRNLNTKHDLEAARREGVNR
jgi:molybdopterin-guanine dinucleotide biosynthesis protein A